mgnify:CR=1 FL=1
MGKMMIKGMNVGHSKVADWGISHLQSMEPKAILEIGCGGGRNVAELLKKYPNAKVTAVDYSPLSVEKTEEVNAEMIKSGRCTVKEADVSNLNSIWLRHLRPSTFGRDWKNASQKYMMCSWMADVS